MCQALNFAIDFELYWPYFIYCCCLLGVFARTLWFMGRSKDSLEALVENVAQLLRRSILRMVVKALSVWLIGGSIVFAFGAWLCKML